MACSECGEAGHNKRTHAADQAPGAEQALFTATVSGIVGGAGPTPGYSQVEAERLADDGMTVGAHELLAELDQELDAEPDTPEITAWPVYSDVAQLNYAAGDDPAHREDNPGAEIDEWQIDAEAALGQAAPGSSQVDPFPTHCHHQACRHHDEAHCDASCGEPDTPQVTYWCRDCNSTTPGKHIDGCAFDPGDPPSRVDAPSVMGDTGVIYVCSVCQTPTESEPCQQHQPKAWAEAVAGTVLDPRIQQFGPVPIVVDDALQGNVVLIADFSAWSADDDFPNEITPPWRTALGPDEPIRITEPGVYYLTADEYHNPAITGQWMSNSDGRKILKTCPAQFKWDQDHGIRKTSDAFDFGHVAHTVVLGRGEEYKVFEPKKLDGRTKEGKAQKLEVDAARAAGLTPIYGDQWATIRAMADAIHANPVANELLTQPGRPEACLFWRDQVKVDGVWVTVQRRAMVDLLPNVTDPGEPMRVVDFKTADEVAPNDNLRKKIYDYGYHRQGATIVDACQALFGRYAEVVFLLQSKTAPHFVVPVDLDTPAQRIGAIENQEALRLWARAQLTGVWPEYTNGVVTSGVPAWIERQYEDEMVIG